MADWSYRQKYLVRASSMLLCFVLVVPAGGLSERLFRGLVHLRPRLAETFCRFGVNLDRYALFAGLPALGFSAIPGIEKTHNSSSFRKCCSV